MNWKSNLTCLIKTGVLFEFKNWDLQSKCVRYFGSLFEFVSVSYRVLRIGVYKNNGFSAEPKSWNTCYLWKGQCALFIVKNCHCIANEGGKRCITAVAQQIIRVP